MVETVEGKDASCRICHTAYFEESLDNGLCYACKESMKFFRSLVEERIGELQKKEIYSYEQVVDVFEGLLDELEDDGVEGGDG